MNYNTIADIYSANAKIREGLTATVANISDSEVVALPDGEKWSIQQIVEHVSIVEHNIARICAKLLHAAKSAGKLSDGTVSVSAAYSERSAEAANLKLDAPERVQPTGEVTIRDAFEAMRATSAAFDTLREDLEHYDLSEPKFPHPFFGDLTAAEWLILAGGHEHRHTRQILRLLEKIRQRQVIGSEA